MAGRQSRSAQLVLLHGFTHTGASWQPVIDRLSESYTPVAPDIRGHGAASERRPVTLDAVIGDISALAGERFVLAGYSMGGRIALHAALALAPRVTGLVLISASPGLADPAQRAARRIADDRLADELERESIEEFARRWERNPVLSGLEPPAAALLHADRLRNTPAGLARALRGLGTGVLAPLWERLPELEVPVTLIAGRRDEKFVELAEAMATRIPRARVVIVPGAGHAVHAQDPSGVARALIDC